VLCAVASAQPVELWEHLPKVLDMFPPQVRLLKFTSPTPHAAFRGQAIYNSIIIDHLILGGDDEARRANDAIRGQSDSVMDPSALGYRVEVANRRTFDSFARTSCMDGVSKRNRRRTATDLKKIVVPDTHDLSSPVFFVSAKMSSIYALSRTCSR
jgi:hypothetical protein